MRLSTKEGLVALVKTSSALLRPRLRGNVLESAVSNARRPPEFPFNTELGLLSDTISIIKRKATNLRPELYWQPGIHYDPLDVFNVAIEFTDKNDLQMPNTAIPPEEDINKYLDWIKQQTRKITVVEQLNYLLECSQGNLCGAANIGLLATRHLARGWDNRAYPNIYITPKDTLKLGRTLAQFESFKHDYSDSSGDTYYYWTHFLGAIVFRQNTGIEAKFCDTMFSVGTPIMKFVRRHIVGQPTIGGHIEASILGRNIGLAIAEMIDTREIC